MSCTYYKFESSLFGGDYTCIKDPDDTKIISSDHYYKYCRNYDYRDCPIYKHQDSSGTICFITTVTCEILGLPDNHETLNTLRSFRDNILQKDKQYANVLKIYDSIGPLVADAIRNDENKEKVAVDLYKSSLLPIAEEIKNNNYNKAIKYYLYMTLSLIRNYDLTNTYRALKKVDFGFTNFDQTKAGHGRNLSLRQQNGTA